MQCSVWNKCCSDVDAVHGVAKGSAGMIYRGSCSGVLCGARLGWSCMLLGGMWLVVVFLRLSFGIKCQFCLGVTSVGVGTLRVVVLLPLGFVGHIFVVMRVCVAFVVSQ